MLRQSDEEFGCDGEEGGGQHGAREVGARLKGLYLFGGVAAGLKPDERLAEALLDLADATAMAV